MIFKIIRVKGAGLQRTLPLFATRMLERRLAASSSTGPPFPDAIGGWRDPTNLSRELREARGSGESSGSPAPCVRKTCATLLDEGELSARQIADHLGRAKVLMIQDNYLGRRFTGRRTAQTLDAAIGRTLG